MNTETTTEKTDRVTLHDIVRMIVAYCKQQSFDNETTKYLKQANMDHAATVEAVDLYVWAHGEAVTPDNLMDMYHDYEALSPVLKNYNGDDLAEMVERFEQYADVIDMCELHDINSGSDMDDMMEEIELFREYADIVDMCRQHEIYNTSDMQDLIDTKDGVDELRIALNDTADNMDELAALTDQLDSFVARFKATVKEAKDTILAV